MLSLRRTSMRVLQAYNYWLPTPRVQPPVPRSRRRASFWQHCNDRPATDPWTHGGTRPPQPKSSGPVQKYPNAAEDAAWRTYAGASTWADSINASCDHASSRIPRPKPFVPSQPDEILHRRKRLKGEVHAGADYCHLRWHPERSNDLQVVKHL